MPRHRYAVNNAGSNARGLKFSELRKKKKRGRHSKRRHFAVVEGISLFPMFLRKKKINVWKYLGGLQSFWRLLCKRNAAGETTPRSNRMEIQTCKRFNIRFPRLRLPHAQTYSALKKKLWVTCGRAAQPVVATIRLSQFLRDAHVPVNSNSVFVKGTLFEVAVPHGHW